MKKEIGKNMSSGAEKVESLGKQNTEKASRAKSAAKTQNRSTQNKNAEGAPKQESVIEQAIEAEKQAADARFEAAKARAAKKEARKMNVAKERQERISKKLEKRQARQEARAEQKSRRAEKQAARAARKEMLAQESKADRRARLEREKRERRALRSQKVQEREQKQRAQQEARNKTRRQRAAAREKKQRERQAARTQKKSSAKKSGGQKRASVGGWIVAVSTLGAACLALSAVVTVGYFRMNDMAMQSENGYRSTLYEIVSVSEAMDDHFAKLRVSSGRGMQRELLTQILVESALLESALEKMPVEEATGTDISSFINRTNATARGMLGKLSAGESLTKEDQARIAALYEINAKLCTELNDLALHSTAKDMQAFFDGAQGTMQNRLAELGHGMREGYENITDAPFAGEGNVEKNALFKATEISAADAEQKVRQFFEGYHIADVRLTGETLARDVKAYNFVLTDENGMEIFAQITKNGGQLAFFDSYEACSEKNFDLESCDNLARAYLSGLGYEHLTPVWFSDAGSVASITYVAQENGVRMYPDMIRVRVCEQKGRVVGMDARSYLVNHHGERQIKAALSQEEVSSKIASSLTVRSSHLALVPFAGREVPAYEFDCTAGEEQFIVFLDARSGEEIRIFRVHASAQGSYLS